MTGPNLHSGRQDQNGHRRRELVRRIKASATHCSLCHQPLNPTAKWPALDATVIDEDLPRARGGSPLDPRNTSAMHNRCNRWKSTRTIAECHQLIALGARIDRPLTKAQANALLHGPIGGWSPTASHW